MIFREDTKPLMSDWLVIEEIGMGEIELDNRSSPPMPVQDPMGEHDENDA